MDLPEQVGRNCPVTIGHFMVNLGRVGRRDRRDHRLIGLVDNEHLRTWLPRVQSRKATVDARHRNGAGLDAHHLMICMAAQSPAALPISGEPRPGPPARSGAGNRLNFYGSIEIGQP